MRTSRFLALISALLLSGCASHIPYRTDLVTITGDACPASRPDATPCIHAATPEADDDTPEVHEDYELHFVEFDDQGWLHSLTPASLAQGASATATQIDHLMKRLRDLMQSGTDVNIVLYAHGWKHRSHTSDGDVINFRRLLRSVTAMERGYIEHNPRKTFGIYLGWRGKSWEIPDPVLSLTFWTRKNAALRVANGSVQELLSRLAVVQRYYNSPEQSNGCGVARPMTTGIASNTQRCKIRMLMIGHSFGAWILYSAIHGSLIESLSVQQDLPQKDTRNQRTERVADLIVLINPAFEASRYESLYQAARRYQPRTYEAPLLVTVTSRADWATRYAFPMGRFFNTIVELPVASREQWEAMNHTPGHLDRYVTHHLRMSDKDHCPGWKLSEEAEIQGSHHLKVNKAAEKKAHDTFFSTYGLSTGLLKPAWTRPFCGGTQLIQLNRTSSEHRDGNSLLWNIQTEKNVMGGHNDIMGLPFREFIRQLYSDVWRSERNRLP